MRYTTTPAVIEFTLDELASLFATISKTLKIERGVLVQYLQSITDD
jgi:hypothetical protein